MLLGYDKPGNSDWPLEASGGNTLTSESSVLTLDHLTTPVMEHGPTSAFDPDRDYCRSERSLFDFDPYSHDNRAAIGIGGYNASRDYLEGIRSELSRTLVDHQSNSTDLSAWRTSETPKVQREAYQECWVQIRVLYQINPTDLRNRFDPEPARRIEQARGVHQEYVIRIEALRSDAILDDFDVNKESEENFWSFFESVPFASKADVVLLENGNLRAIWGGEDSSHLGLQFLGDSMVQYVIFRRRKRGGHISRVAGRDTFEGIKKQVQNFKLDAFLKI